MREVAPDDFESGEWSNDLAALLNQPPPPERMATNGDEFIADYLLKNF